MEINKKDMKSWLKDKNKPVETPEGETDEEKSLLKILEKRKIERGTLTTNKQ